MIGPSNRLRSSRVEQTNRNFPDADRPPRCHDPKCSSNLVAEQTAAVPVETGTSPPNVIHRVAASPRARGWSTSLAVPFATHASAAGISSCSTTSSPPPRSNRLWRSLSRWWFSSLYSEHSAPCNVSCVQRVIARPFLTCQRSCTDRRKLRRLGASPNPSRERTTLDAMHHESAQHPERDHSCTGTSVLSPKFRRSTACLSRRGRVANPRDTYVYRCGLRLAAPRNPSRCFRNDSSATLD